MAGIINYLETQLLQMLIKNTHFLTIDQLSEVLHVSRRSIYNYLKGVSEYLRSNNIEPPRNIRGSGYYLPEVSKATAKKLLEDTSLTSNEGYSKLSSITRQNLILLVLFSGSQKVSINRLAKVTGVTRNTVLSDLSQASKKLESEHIRIIGSSNGQRLAGNEIIIRNYYHAHFQSFLASYEWIKGSQNSVDLFNLKDLQGLDIMLNEWLHLIEQESSRSFSDDAIRLMELYYAFVLRRILTGQMIEPDTFPASDQDRGKLKIKEEFSFATKLLAQVGVDVVNHDSEVFYLESLLLGSQLKKVNEQAAEDHDVYNEVRGATEKVVDNFQQLAEVKFQNRSQLINELYIHLLSTYYRVKFQGQYKDGMVKTIQDNYPDIYTFTKLSVRPFEKLNKQVLNDNEISLIAIYFGSQMYRKSKQGGSALLVCSTGLGTSRMLKAQLSSVFPTLRFVGPITSRSYLAMSHIEEDIVLSTIPLKQKNKEVLNLRPVMNDDELNELKKKLISKGITLSNLSQDRVSALLDVIADNAEIKNQVGLVTGLREVLSFPVAPYLKLKEGYQPLLSELINKSTIQFAKADQIDWEKAIEIASKPLLDRGNIKQSYVDAMIKSVNENGPYINIGDRIAFAHARPEAGVNKLGMALLHLDQPINLVDDDHKIQLIFVLAAADSKSHLKALSELAEMLGDRNKLDSLIGSTSISEVESIILKGEK